MKKVIKTIYALGILNFIIAITILTDFGNPRGAGLGKSILEIIRFYVSHSYIVSILCIITIIVVYKKGNKINNTHIIINSIIHIIYLIIFLTIAILAKVFPQPCLTVLCTSSQPLCTSKINLLISDEGDSDEGDGGI
jgi:hypothetical protein